LVAPRRQHGGHARGNGGGGGASQVAGALTVQLGDAGVHRRCAHPPPYEEANKQADRADTGNARGNDGPYVRIGTIAARPPIIGSSAACILSISGAGGGRICGHFIDRP